MKKSVLAIVLVGICVVATAIANVNAAVKPEKGILIGTVIELSTYTMTGDMVANLEAAKSRAEHGFPVALIEEETGTLWILVFRRTAPASHMETANEKVQEFMGMKVVMQGLKYENEGVHLIRLSVISEY